MAFRLSFRVFDDLRLDGVGRFLQDQAQALAGIRLDAELLRPVVAAAAAGEDGLGRIADALRDEATGRVGPLNLERLEALAAGLPPGLAGPDATGEVPTGASAITREEALLDAVLSASARVVRALGPTAEVVEVEGRRFGVVDRYDDPVSGFDALHLRAVDGGGEDAFVIDGLEVGSVPDTLAAIGLARPQAASAEFARLVADARDAALLEGREIAILGPSLGGALAQVAAYETAEALLAAGAAPGAGSIRLLTVDALGGRDAAEDLNGGALDPAVLRALNAVNLRTEGDLVSRIGSHLGETISFRPVDAEGRPVELSAAETHVNVESLLATLRSDALFAAGVPGAPREIGGFALASDTFGAGAAEQARRAGGDLDDPEGAIPLQVTGTARFDATGTRWTLDADRDGVTDLAVALSAPPANAADLVFG